MKTYTEGSEIAVTVEPFNTSGSSYTPTTMRYRVDDYTSGKPLVAWTTVTPATLVSISIPASKNTIINRSAQYEIKVVTLQSNTGLDSQYNQAYPYRLENLQFIT